ncbi:MAG: tetratricopeptide repeat protein, partial [Spirochaetaceae bacterium]|nr:tetratricopeptide repeat protein [Spirochaetaceae bacterium]
MGFLPFLVAIVLVLAVVVASSLATSSRKGHESGAHRPARLRTKDKAQILKEANRRLASNPKDVDALAALGGVHWDDQDWERALKTYETLAEAGAGNPEVDEFTANMRYGVAAVRLGRLDEAYKGLVVARSIKQDDFEVNFNLGFLEFQKKAYEKAVLLLRQASVANPDHPSTLRYLGHSYFKVKSYKDALISLRKAIDLQPDDKESLFAVAECYYELGNSEQALKIFTHLRADPALGPSAALFAGTVHMNQRLYDRAIMDFEIGLRHQTARPEVTLELKYRLAAACLKGQDLGKA